MFVLNYDKKTVDLYNFTTLIFYLQISQADGCIKPTGNPFSSPNLVLSPMRCPELRTMGIVLPEYLAGMNQSIRKYEGEHAQYKNKAPLEYITTSTSNNGTILESTLSDTNIFNIRDPICPGTYTN